MDDPTYDPQAYNSRFSVYRSHKVVRAAKISTLWGSGVVGVEPDGHSVTFDPKGKPTPAVGWWVIAYDDGYVSFCPPEQFEKGYRLHQNTGTCRACGCREGELHKPNCAELAAALHKPVSKPLTPEQLYAVAQAAHETNRAYCIAIGDMSQPAWEDAPDWQRSSAVNGVSGVLAGNNPEQSHESWLREKRETGWVYGPVKDPAKKEHPCMVPYAELPAAQRAKDHVYVAVVRAMTSALTG